MAAEAPTLYPAFRYRDAPAAIQFIKAAFGFRERVVYANPDGTIAHAELSYGPGILMLGTVKDDVYHRHVGEGSVYVSVDDTDAHYQQARAAGAEIIVDPHDTEYGSRDYAARDPEGNVWNFGTYRPAAEEPETTASGAVH